MEARPAGCRSAAAGFTDAFASMVAPLPVSRRRRRARAEEDPGELSFAELFVQLPHREERDQRDEEDDRPGEDLVDALARDRVEASRESLAMDQAVDHVLQHGEDRDEHGVHDGGTQHHDHQRAPGVPLAEPHRLADEDHLGDHDGLDDGEAVVERGDPELARDEPPVGQEGAEENREIDGDDDEEPELLLRLRLQLRVLALGHGPRFGVRYSSGLSSSTAGIIS